MSKSNASAKNRRAFGGNPTGPNPPIQNFQQSQTQPQGFTLQQVISVIDSRLLNLEEFMKETKENSGKNLQQYNATQQYNNNETENPMNDNSVTDVLNEFNNRFELLAQEIGDLKDIVLKLQSFTMDVNKTLLEERIRVFSDLGENGASLDNQVFELSSATMNNENVDSVDLKNLVKEEFSQSS